MACQHHMSSIVAKVLHYEIGEAIVKSQQPIYILLNALKKQALRECLLFI